MTSRFVFAVAIVATTLVVVGCGGNGRPARSSASRSSTAPSVAVVRAPAERCRFESVFEALAEINGGSVVCPTWLPHGLRARALTVGNSEQVSSDQMSLSGRHWSVTVGAPPNLSSPGRLIERARLGDGTEIVVRTAGHRFVVVAHIPDAGGQQLAQMTLTWSHVNRSAALVTAKRLVRSLRVLPSDIIRGHPACQYPAVFAAVAMIAGAHTAMCPRWLPSNITLDLASAGPLDEYNPVEFDGGLDNGLFPHIVFEWVTHAPPGRPLTRMAVNRGRRAPIYFQPAGVALNSGHLIAILSPPSANPGFWVSLHDSYGSRHATEAVLRRIVDSLRPLNPLSASPRP